MPAKQPSLTFVRFASPLSLLLFAFLCGCSSSTAPPSVPQSPSTEKQAKTPDGPPVKEVLEKMRAVYRDAEAYTDNASIVFHAVVRSTGGEQETPFSRTSLAFARPNQVHVTYQKNISSPQEESYKIVSNGTLVRSTANEIPQQIHEAIAPLVLTTENFIPEPALRVAVLEESLENTFPQLALLLEDEKEQAIFPGEDQAQRLADAELDGIPYYRIEMPSPAGKRVLWIDQKQYTLRRMEIPIDNQRQQINARNQFSNIAVWVDFDSVTIDSEIESATFNLAVPEGARRVRRFIPPPPAGPAAMFGKPVGEFSFTTLEGEEVTPKTLEGKVTVLDFWFTNCPPCKSQTPVLNQVYEHFKDSKDVAFYAVSTDSRVVDNEVVAKTLVSWGGHMPCLRDLKSTGNRMLKVRQTPTLLLADRKGHLQVFQVGAHQRPEPIIDVIQRLVDGEDLVAADRAKHAEYTVMYEKALESATINDSILEVEIARPEVAPRQLPKKVQLKQLWQTSTEQLLRPGDVQIVADKKAESFRLLVLDAGEAIVEIDTAGKTVGRHELPAHEEQAGGFLRTWENDKGERWTLASGVGWQKVHVFDKKWETILSFPDERHSGIGDVLFTDLTGSGTPVMHVGYWGGLGVQGGTLDGRRLWSNRQLNHVLQVGSGPSLPANKQAATSGGQTAWCTSTRGTLLQIGADGKAIQERYILGQSLMYFASDSTGENHCGLSIGKVGQYTAVGFDTLGAVAWEHPLPPGEYVEQVPRIQSISLGGDNLWLIAAANGSLLCLSETGELIDQFDVGEILTGVAFGTSGEETLLFVATAKNLTAWQVNPLPEPQTPPPAKKEQPPKQEAKKEVKPPADEPESSKAEEPSKSQSPKVDPPKAEASPAEKS